MARFWKLLVMVCFLIIADQISKGWVQSSFQHGEMRPLIDGFLYVTHVHNRGAAFGFLNTHDMEALRMVIFRWLPLVFSGWVAYMMVKTIKGPFYMSLAYALILAGAVGNLIDRFALGYVVDFVLFYYWPDKDFPAFNLADSCITIAAFLLIWDMLQQTLLKRKSPGADA